MKNFAPPSTKKKKNIIRFVTDREVSNRGPTYIFFRFCSVSIRIVGIRNSLGPDHTLIILYFIIFSTFIILVGKNQPCRGPTTKWLQRTIRVGTTGFHRAGHPRAVCNTL